MSSGGSPATISFEYGSDTTYGSIATVPGTMPTNTFQYFPSTRATGLTQQTIYHWRAKLTNQLARLAPDVDRVVARVAPELLRRSSRCANRSRSRRSR